MEEFKKRELSGELWDFVGLVDSRKVYVEHNPECGLCVRAAQNLKKDEIVEVGVMYRLVGVDANNDPRLFTWSDDRTVWAGASGCITFYNHSTNNPNVRKIGDLVNDRMMVVALRDIEVGEELRNTYHSAKWRKVFVEQKLADYD